MKLYKRLNEALTEAYDVRALKLTIKSEELPPELFHFPNLEELFLEGNCTHLPELSMKWEKLKTLSIKFPNFKGEASSLFNLPSLGNLKLIQTPLKMLTLPLGHAVAPLKSLTIKECGLRFLPEEIGSLNHLVEMNVSENQLTDLPYSFHELIRLKRLNLDHNSFRTFPDHIKKNRSLIHLSIDFNNFNDEEKARIQRQFHILPQ